MCSRCDLSSRERVTINIQQPSNNWPTINLLSVYYSLSFSFFLSISLYLSLYVTFNHYPFTHHSQCRFTETLCVLQVGASSRRRAMALRWRNRPTAAQRSRTMTWKVGPPRILCLSLSPLEKKKKIFYSSSPSSRAFFFRALTLSSTPEIYERTILQNRRILNTPTNFCVVVPSF